MPTRRGRGGARCTGRSASCSRRAEQSQVVAEHWLLPGSPREPVPACWRPRGASARSTRTEIRPPPPARRSSSGPRARTSRGASPSSTSSGRCAQLCGELAEAERAWEEVAAGLVRRATCAGAREVTRRLATVYELQKASPKAGRPTWRPRRFRPAGLHAEASTEWRRRRIPRPTIARHVDHVERARDSAGAPAGRISRAAPSGSSASGPSSPGASTRGLSRRSALSLALAGNHVDAALEAYWALGALANQRGDYPRAESTFEEAIDFCRAHDRPPMEKFCVSCLAVVLFNRGEWDPAEGLARKSRHPGSAGTTRGRTRLTSSGTSRPHAARERRVARFSRPG